MPLIQESIHKLEVAGGLRYLKIGLAVLVFVAVTAVYNFRSFKNMSSPEAMDSAQLGRNISQGKGYTTYFVRPFSMYLLKRHNEKKPGAASRRSGDLTELTGKHPDIANAPVYPLVLGGVMKILPFEFKLPERAKTFWSQGGNFYRYQPDFLISAFNQLLFFAVIGLVFLLARRLFDSVIAWMSAALLFVTELFWRFSVSGLSTMLLLLIFTCILWCLVLLEEEGRETKRGLALIIVVAVMAGALTGLGGLTRYAFAWMILPVLAFLLLYSGPRRIVLAAAALLAFTAVTTPWIARNYHVSGTPFGTAGYAIYEGTGLFPEHRLQRSLDPDLGRPRSQIITQKLLVNARKILENDLPRLGGSWLTAFFLVGLMTSFSNPTASRLRLFLLACLGMFVVIQALGRTQLSDDSPDLNTENLLVLFAPLVFVFGISFFWLLLGQVFLPIRELRFVVIGCFCALACLPMVFTFLPPKSFAIAWPPYFPPYLQTAGGYTRENELTMSDIPWAMAWYGNVQSLWLTLNAQDLVDITDYQKRIQVLYLSRRMLDRPFYTGWIEENENNWGSVIGQAIAGVSQDPTRWPKQVNLSLRRPDLPPANYPTLPLHYLQAGWPGQLVLTHRDRAPIVQ